MQKVNLNLPSTRQYLVAFIEGDAICSYFVKLSEILNDPDGYGSNQEYCYALQERFDELLDLKIGERLLVQFNRDDKDSEGFIKRIR